MLSILDALGFVVVRAIPARRVCANCGDLSGEGRLRDSPAHSMGIGIVQSHVAEIRRDPGRNSAIAGMACLPRNPGEVPALEVVVI